MKLSQKYIIFFPMFLQASYWGMMKVALPDLPRLHKIFGVSEYKIHMIVSLSFILAGLSAIVWGHIIDRMKLKVFIFTTVFLAILTLIITTSARYFWVFGIFYVFSCIMVASYAVYSRSFPVLYLSDAKLIKKSLSFRLMGGFSAAFIAPFLGGLISVRYGWRYTFVVIIVWLLFIQIFAHFIGYDDEKSSRIVNPQDKLSDSIRQTVMHLKNNKFLCYLIILGCGNAISQSYIIATPFWLDKAYNIPIDMIALYLLPFFLPGMLLPLFSGFFIHHIEEKKIIFGYLLIFILSGILPFFFTFIKFPPAWIWLIPGVLANFSMVGLAPIFSYDALFSIQSYRAAASGLISTSSYLFGGCAMYLTLFIKLKDFYWEGCFILSMAFIMCSLLFLVRRIPPKID